MHLFFSVIKYKVQKFTLRYIEVLLNEMYNIYDCDLAVADPSSITDAVAVLMFPCVEQ